MTQKVYVYIPGLEYVSKGPLHIDAIKLDVTVNQTKGSDNNINVVPVYTDITKENGQIKLTAGNVIYKSIYYPAKDTIRDDITNPTTSSHPHRAARGRYYDFLERNEETGKIKKQEDGSVKHLITFYQDSKNGYTCSNQSILEHDGLFIVELEKLNTDLILDFTFYSRINESTVSNDNIAFGEQEENPDFEKIDTTKYIEVGTWSQSYNPAISGVKLNPYKLLEYRLQYFNLKEDHWESNERTWEVPVNADFLVSDLSKSNTLLKASDGKYINKLYSYDQNLRIHYLDLDPNTALPCNKRSYSEYPTFYRKFYRRIYGETLESSDTDTAQDELLDTIKNGSAVTKTYERLLIDSYTVNGNIMVGLTDTYKNTTEIERYHKPILLSYGNKKYNKHSLSKDYYISYADFTNFKYLYKTLPKVVINNVANKSDYAETSSSRPVALFRINGYELVKNSSALVENNLTPSPSALSGLFYRYTKDGDVYFDTKERWNNRSVGMMFYSGEQRDLYRMSNNYVNEEAGIAWGKNQTFKNFINKSNLGEFEVLFLLTYPDGQLSSCGSKGKISIENFYYNGEVLENYFVGAVGNKALAFKTINASRAYNFKNCLSEDLHDHSQYYYKRDFYWGCLLNFNGSNNRRITSETSLLNGGDVTVTLCNTPKITLTKSVTNVTIPMWRVETNKNAEVYEVENTDAKLLELYNKYKNGVSATQNNAGFLANTFDTHTYRNLYLFIPEMWYIDLNKSKITYNNKSDYAICPMIYNDSNGEDREGNGAPLVNVLLDNLLIDTSVLEADYEIQKVFDSNTLFKSPFELKKSYWREDTTGQDERINFDSTFCTKEEKRFIQPNTYPTTLKLRKQFVILDAHSLYVFKLLTLFYNLIEDITLSYNFEQSYGGVITFKNGIALVYNNTDSPRKLLLHSFQINSLSKKYDPVYKNNLKGYSVEYNVLSGFGLYKVNLNDTSITTIKLKEAFDTAYFDKFGITSNASFLNDIILPIAYCALENIEFCKRMNIDMSYRRKPIYENWYWTNNNDPIYHNYNFKYLPEQAIYKIIGYYTLPSEDETDLSKTNYIPFDSGNDQNTNITLPQLIASKKVRQLQA